MPATGTGHVRVDIDGGVATVRFDRPPVNAVNLDVIEEFLGAADAVGTDPAVRCVVVTGTAERFCAGADIAMMADLSRANHRLVRRWIEVQAALEALPKPVIAAINGYALGGGFELALACDVRIIGSATRVGLPEIRLGLFPGAAGTQRLARLLGPSRALQIMMEGREFTGDEAAAAGLADHVVAEAGVLAEATRRAERLAQGPTRAYGLLKQAVYGGFGRSLPDGLAIEQAAVFELISSRDTREGLAAFTAKRPPRFTGR